MFNELVDEEMLISKEKQLDHLISQNTTGVLEMWIPFVNKCLKLVQNMNSWTDCYKIGDFKLINHSRTFGFENTFKLYLNGKRIVKVETTRFNRIIVSSLEWNPAYKCEIERFYIEVSVWLEQNLEKDLCKQEQINAETELIMFD